MPDIRAGLKGLNLLELANLRSFQLRARKNSMHSLKND